MATATKSRDDLKPLVAAQAATRDSVNLQVAALVAVAVRGFSGWYDPAEVGAWAESLARTVQPLLRLLARNTDAYMARSVSGVSGSSFRPVGAIDVADLRAGVTHAGAYARAADAYRYQQFLFDQTARAIGRRVTLVEDAVTREISPYIADAPEPLEPPTIVDPIEAAARRAEDVADQDAALVVQQQSKATLQAAEDRGLVTGWRRVLHPELSEGGSCGLCVAASTRLYRVEDLMPIHGRCKCVPAAVRGDQDPGDMLNEVDLERVYADAGSTGRAALKRTRYRIDEHGNLGPQLVAADAPKREDSSRRKAAESTSPEQSAEKARKVRDELEAILPKAKALAEENPAKWGDYYQKLEDRVADLTRQLT